MPALPVLFAALLAIIPLAGQAQQKTVLLELFTSQGCSSCPPADELLPHLAQVPGVLALALHVDYWDYLGWTDSFALPENTTRQRAYAKALRQQSIFTPQMVVQGSDVLIGHKAERILAAIRAHQALPDAVSIAIDRHGDMVVIALVPEVPIDGPSDVHLVSYVPADEVSIGGGENAGRDITYTHVVTGWRTVARWDGREPVALEVPAAPDDNAVVIVQRTKAGPVLAASKLP
jgi:hypothetical protein